MSIKRRNEAIVYSLGDGESIGQVARTFRLPASRVIKISNAWKRESERRWRRLRELEDREFAEYTKQAEEILPAYLMAMQERADAAALKQRQSGHPSACVCHPCQELRSSAWEAP